MLTRGHTSKMQLSAVLAAIAILCYNIREMRILSTLSLLTAQQNFPFHITQKFHILRGQLAEHFPEHFILEHFPNKKKAAQWICKGRKCHYTCMTHQGNLEQKIWAPCSDLRLTWESH